MRTIKPAKENAMVTGEGGFGLDVLPYDRRTKESQEKVRDEDLGFTDLKRLVKRLVLDS